MTAVLAILVDSYRELIAKKMFWFVLTISLLIVLTFGSIGFNDKGVSIGFGLYTFESQSLRADSPWIKPFMDLLFGSFIVKLWLAWGAIILALVSVAEVFPNFLAGGAIDLVLSKPVRRTTVFLTKYAGSLLFVFMQVAIFCVGTLIVIRFRVGEWRWAILVAIPVLVLVFSYLYSIMVLLNVLTRSTLPSLVLTLFVWMSIFSLHAADSILLLNFRAPAEVDRNAYARRVEWYDEHIVEAQAQGDTALAERYRGRRRVDEAKRDDAQERLEKWGPMHVAVRIMTYLLPRTSSTTDLVQRQLDTTSSMSSTEFFRAMGGEGSQPPAPPPPPSEEESAQTVEQRRQREIMRYVQEDADSQSAWSIIGTSLVFEGVMLGMACFLFVRRDS